MGWYSDIIIAVCCGTTDHTKFIDWLQANSESISEGTGHDFDSWMGLGNMKVSNETSKNDKLFPKESPSRILIKTNIKYGTLNDVEHIIEGIKSYFNDVVHVHGEVWGEDAYANMNMDGDNIIVYDGTSTETFNGFQDPSKSALELEEAKPFTVGDLLQSATDRVNEYEIMTNNNVVTGDQQIGI